MPPLARAALWMTGAIGSFTTMALAGRAVSFELDTFEIMLYRSLTGIVIVLIVASLRGTLGQVTARTPGLQIIRNLAHFTGQNLWFYALTVLPLAQVFALEFTSPVWVILLSPMMLGERITGAKLLAAALGFGGILLVARPDVVGISPGVIAAAGAAVGFAITGIFTRKLTQTESITCILVWLTGLQALFGLICAGYDGQIAVPSLATAPLLFLIGCAGLLAHFCLTTALSLAPASLVMPMDFVRLPMIAVVGALVYNEAVAPLVFVGAALILGGNWINLRASSRS